MNEECKKQNRNCRVKWNVLLLLLALAILLMVILAILLQRENQGENVVKIIVSSENAGEGVGLVIDPNAENGQVSNDNTVEQDVAISGRKTMTIPANQKEITVDFYNPKENDGAYYLTFELRLCDDSKQGYEVLYTSGLVEPGKHIDKITLSRALDKGTYESVLHVQPHRMNEEQTYTNNADIKMKLIVK